MNRKLLQKAIDNLSIQMIYLHSSETKIHNGFDPLIPNQELVGQYGITPKSCRLKEVQDTETGEKYRFLVYQTEAAMRYLIGSNTDELKESLENEELLDKLIAAEIKATFVSEYLIKCNEELPEDVVSEFGRLNVPHQIWAYWREYCHSTCARMSLPVSILPMFSINKSS
jgi:hypothetical protein